MPGSKDTGETRVAGTGSVYIAPAGTLLPSAYNGPLAAAFVELGYTDEDGVTFTDEPSIEKKGAWQSFYPVRILETARMAKAAMKLEQWNGDTLRAASGGGTVTAAGSGKKFTPHAAGTVTAWSVVIDVIDGSITDRYVISKCLTTSTLEVALKRSDLALLPFDVEAIGEDGVDPWFMFTSDTVAFVNT